MKLPIVTAETFQREVLESPVPVVIDFFAPWCAPCRVIAPILDELAAAYEGRVKVVKIDTDQDPELAVRFQVRGMPTVHGVDRGRVIASVYGAAPRSRFVALFDKLTSQHGLVAEAAART